MADRIYVVQTVVSVAVEDDARPGLRYCPYGYSFAGRPVFLAKVHDGRTRHDVILNALANEALARHIPLTQVSRITTPKKRSAPPPKDQKPLF